MAKPVITEVQVMTIEDFDPVVNGNTKYPWTLTPKGKSFPFPTGIVPKTQIYAANKRYKDRGIRFTHRTKDGVHYAHCIADGRETQIRSVA